MTTGPSDVLRLAARRSRAAIALLRANAAALDAPAKVNLCVTYRCNYRCRTCNIWQRRPTDELTTRELLAFASANRSIGWLDVTGGEIFLRQDIGEVLEFIATEWKQLALLHFPTNGFLTERIVAITSRVAAATPAEFIVTVSLDGDETLNDEIRGISGGYRRQIETFNALRGISGVRAVLGMTLSRHNAGQFERTFEACQGDCPGLTVEDFHLNVAQRSDHYYGHTDEDAVSLAPDVALDEITRYRLRRHRSWSLSSWVEGQYLKHLEGFLRTGDMPMRCHALRSSCFVDPWGTVYPCISYSRPLGQLRETSMDLDPIWRRQATRKVQSEIWEGDCPRCWTPCEAYQSILGNAVRGNA